LEDGCSPPVLAGLSVPGEEVAVQMLWAYAYQIVPPQPSNRLGTIRALLRDETAAARGGARTWSGRIVLERRATHILIVSDGPGRNDSINRQLEAELERLGAAFSVTDPLEVADHADVLATYAGNGR
jgi:hypothetical protein